MGGPTVRLTEKRYAGSSRSVEIGLTPQRPTGEGLPCRSSRITIAVIFTRDRLLTAFGTDGSSGIACSPEGGRWSAQLSSFPVAFGSGTVTLSVQPTNQCDSQGCQPEALIGLGYSASFSSKISLNRGK